jgi:hypothetical protein
MAEPDLSLMRRLLEEARAANREARPLAPGGSGPHDPGMESRVAKVEADVGHIQHDITDIKTDIREIRKSLETDFREIRKSLETDFRLLFGALIVAVLGLAGIMAKGFHWL